MMSYWKTQYIAKSHITSNKYSLIILSKLVNLFVICQCLGCIIESRQYILACNLILNHNFFVSHPPCQFTEDKINRNSSPGNDRFAKTHFLTDTDSWSYFHRLSSYLLCCLLICSSRSFNNFPFSVLQYKGPLIASVRITPCFLRSICANADLE